MFFDVKQGKKFLRERKKNKAEGFENNDNNNDDNDRILVNELSVLEDDFNSKKSAYATSYKSLMDKTQNYISSADNTNTKINKNVYVNQVQNPSTIIPSRVGCYRTNATFETDEYIGTYTDSSTRAMPQTTGTYISYADCKAAAIKGNYTYFALQDYQANNNTAYCSFSKDLTQAEAQGPSNTIITGSDGRKYGGGWANAIYKIGTSVENDTTTEMSYQSDLGTSVSADTCKTRAADLGYSVFALRGSNTTAGSSKCYVGNNSSASIIGGIATKTMVSYSLDQVPNVNIAQLFYNGQIGLYQDTPDINIALDSRLKGVSTCNLLTGAVINTANMIASWGLGCPPVPPTPPTPLPPILIGVGTDNKLYTKTSINTPWTKLKVADESKSYITVGGQIGKGGPLMLIGTDNKVWIKIFLETESIQRPGPYAILGGVIWLNNYNALYAIGVNNAAYSGWNDFQSWGQFNNGGRLLGVILLNDGVSFLGIGMDQSLYTAANQWANWVQLPGNICCVISIAQLPDNSFIAVGPNNDLWTRKSLNATDTWVKVTTTEPIGMLSIGTYTVNPNDPLFKGPPPPQPPLGPLQAGSTPQEIIAYLEILKIKNTEDAIKKASLKAEIASLAVGNWNTYTSIVNGRESADFIVGQAGTDPAPYCQKDFSATYKCGLGPNKSITIAAEAKGKTANFDCTAENAICKGFMLTLGDDGNLVLTDSTKKVVWQSNTNKVGIATPEFTAANGIYGRNYLNAGETLSAGNFIGSPSGNCYLIMIPGSETTPGGLQLQYNISNCSSIGNDSVGSDDTAYAVYNIPGVSSSDIINSMGQVGFIDDNGAVRSYPSEMIQPGTDYDYMGEYNTAGNDLSSFTMTNISPADCKTKCSADNSCAGFVFNKSDNKCYLKSAGMFPKSLRVPDTNSALYVRSKLVQGGDISCPKTMDKSISVAEWVSMPVGEKMQVTTLCKLGLVTQEEQADLNQKNQAVSLAAAKLQAKIDELVKNDLILVNKLGNHVRKLQKDLKQYNTVNRKIGESENTIEGLSGFADDSQLVLISNNYKYLLFSILAILLVGTIIKVSRR